SGAESSGQRGRSPRPEVGREGVRWGCLFELDSADAVPGDVMLPAAPLWEDEDTGVRLGHVLALLELQLATVPEGHGAGFIIERFYGADPLEGNIVFDSTAMAVEHLPRLALV